MTDRIPKQHTNETLKDYVDRLGNMYYDNELLIFRNRIAELLEPMVRAMVNKRIYGDTDTKDDAYGYVYLHGVLPSLETYNPIEGSVMRHVAVKVHFTIIKYNMNTIKSNNSHLSVLNIESELKDEKLPHIEDESARIAFVHAFEAALNRLPKTQQQFATLYIINGERISEVAYHMCIPIKQAQRIRSLTIDRLRRLFADWDK